MKKEKDTESIAVSDMFLAYAIIRLSGFYVMVIHLHTVI